MHGTRALSSERGLEVGPWVRWRGRDRRRASHRAPAPGKDRRRPPPL